MENKPGFFRGSCVQGGFVSYGLLRVFTFLLAYWPCACCLEQFFFKWHEDGKWDGCYEKFCIIPWKFNIAWKYTIPKRGPTIMAFRGELLNFERVLLHIFSWKHPGLDRVLFPRTWPCFYRPKKPQLTAEKMTVCNSILWRLFGEA